MEKEQIELFVGRKCVLMTKRGWVYTGRIQQIGKEFLIFKDKYGKLISIEFPEISMISDAVRGD